jgi:hypothetical protein
VKHEKKKNFVVSFSNKKTNFAFGSTLSPRWKQKTNVVLLGVLGGFFFFFEMWTVDGWLS